VARHASATHVAIRIWRENGSLRCRVRDDGAGFDVRSAMAARGSGRGMGLTGIQERVAALGGSLHIESTPGQGTQLDVSITLETPNGSRDTARG
jgi:two-component system, NarL family, sensor histidine kinase FusK